MVFERIDDDGGCGVKIFTGPNARRQTRQYAEQRYGKWAHFHRDAGAKFGPAVEGLGATLPILTNPIKASSNRLGKIELSIVAFILNTHAREAGETWRPRHRQILSASDAARPPMAGTGNALQRVSRALPLRCTVLGTIGLLVQKVRRGNREDWTCQLMTRW